MRSIDARLAELESTPPIFDDVTLHHLPIAELHTVVEPGSIDAIVTDPPYPQEYLGCWRELAEFASYALRDGGSLLAMTGKFWLPEVFALMDTDGLRYQWTLSLSMKGRSTNNYSRHISRIKWKPILWYVKGEPNHQIIDEIDGSGTDKEYHDWGQSVGEFGHMVASISEVNDIVCDPFVGGGTTAIATLLENRRFIGADIDEECITTTHERIMEAFVEKDAWDR